MTFADQVDTVFDWKPLSQYRGGLNFTAGGRTAFHDVVKQSINAVRALKNSYAVQGIDCKRPQIFIITDGYSTDPEDNPAVVDEAKTLCSKYIDKDNKIKVHVILLPGGSTNENMFRAYKNTTVSNESDSYPSEFKLYKVEDCAYGLPAAGTFIRDSIVTFSSANLGSTVKTKMPEGMKTTQTVQKDDSGNRFVTEKVETWN